MYNIEYFQNIWDKSIIYFRSHRGTECISFNMQLAIELIGGRFLPTPPYSPKMNSIVKRRNQTIEENGHSLEFPTITSAQHLLWDFPLKTATYL